MGVDAMEETGVRNKLRLSYLLASRNGAGRPAPHAKTRGVRHGNTESHGLKLPCI